VKEDRCENTARIINSLNTGWKTWKEEIGGTQWLQRIYKVIEERI
jgi:hypothetical protein